MNRQHPVKILAGRQPFTAEQRETLNAVASLMIPPSPDGRMPGAASLNLYAESRDLPERAVGALQQGVDALQQAASQRFSTPFTQLVSADAQAIVDDLRESQRGFFSAFTLHTVARYYQHDTVLPLIGLPVRPPWPEGNEVKQGDWSLLDPVRERGKVYRDA